jgi:hypothetical protein
MAYSDMGYNSHLRKAHPELTKSESLTLRKLKGMPSGFSDKKSNHYLEQALTRDTGIS